MKSPALLIPQRFDGADLRGFLRGIDTEHDAHQHGDAEGDYYRGRRDDGLPFGGARDQPGAEKTESNSQYAAAYGKQDRLGEETPIFLSGIPGSRGY